MLLICSGCETTKWLRRPVTVNASSFTCPSIPLVPHVDATDNEIADYIVALALTAESCKVELEQELPEDLKELGVVIE